MELIDEFTEELLKDHGEETVKGYVYDLNGFFDYLSEHFDVPSRKMEKYILTVSENDVYSYLNHLVTVKENSPATVNRKLSSIRKFYSFLYRSRRIEADFSRNIKSVKTQGRTEIFTVEELTALLGAVKGRNRSRDLVILGSFIYAALSVSELISLKTEDVRDGRIHIRKDDGSERSIRMNSALSALIDDYLENHKNDDSPYLVSADGKGPISKRTIHMIVVKHMKAAGIYSQGLTTETLRKSGIYLLRKYADFDMNEIKDFLGLKSTSSLKSYMFDDKVSAEERIDRIPITKLRFDQGGN